MPDQIIRLKTETERVFGRKIVTATDCEALADQIFSLTQICISSQTLRRLWQIIKSTSKPSIDTLNTLSKYIGFRDYVAFKSNLENAFEGPILDFELIKILFKQNRSDINNFDLWKDTMVTIIAEQIVSNKNLFESFVEHFSDNHASLDFVLACFQHYEALNKDWFVRGFKICCYKSKELHYKLYFESLMYVGYILRNDQSNGKLHINNIKELLPKVRAKIGFVFPLEGPVFGCLIANALYEGEDSQALQLFQEAKQALHANKEKCFISSSTTTYRSFITNIIEVLIHIEKYEWVLELIKIYKFENEAKNLWHNSQEIYISISKSLTYLMTGNKEMALKLFNKIKINPKLLRFDRKNKIHLYYLYLKLCLTSANAKATKIKIISEMEELITKTGFNLFTKKIEGFKI